MRLAPYLLAVILTSQSLRADGPPPRPVLEIPKATYVLGERIFYWTGVESLLPMSRETYEPCEETVISPTGHVTSRRLEWPLDGVPDYGWRGGSGIAASEAVEGTYEVRVRCGDETTEGVFDVVPFAPVRDFEARFDIVRGCDGRPPDYRVSLSIRNSSADHEAWVAVPGALGSNLVWFSASSGPPERRGCDSFIPYSAFGLEPPRIGSPSYSDLTPETLESVPHVALLPGDAHEWSFCLSSGTSCFDERWVPDSVSVTAVLQVLFRPIDGSGDDAGPMRIPASGESSLRDAEGGRAKTTTLRRPRKPSARSRP